MRDTRMGPLALAAAVLAAAALAACGGETTTGSAGAGTGAGTGMGDLPPGHPMPGTGVGAMPPGHPMPGSGMGAMPSAHPPAGDPHAGGAAGVGDMAMAGPPAAIAWTAPEGWLAKPPSSKMRIAEFALPKAGGDPEDGNLAVFWFGGSGGGVDANINRWLGQFVQPDGRVTKDVAKVEKRTVGTFAVTVVDVSGTFNAEMMPGSGVTATKPGWRMLGAVVEAPEGSYFVKATGPEKTLAAWKKSFDDFLASLKPAAV